MVHTFSPLSSSLVSFELDADDMNIRRVRMKNKDIKFDHSGGKLYIRMDKPIGWNDTVNVRVDYTSFPTVGTFFIRPDETYPDKPWQAWTQGERQITITGYLYTITQMNDLRLRPFLP